MCNAAAWLHCYKNIWLDKYIELLPTSISKLQIAATMTFSDSTDKTMHNVKFESIIFFGNLSDDVQSQKFEKCIECQNIFCNFQ